MTDFQFYALVIIIKLAVFAALIVPYYFN